MKIISESCRSTLGNFETASLSFWIKPNKSPAPTKWQQKRLLSSNRWEAKVVSWERHDFYSYFHGHRGIPNGFPSSAKLQSDAFSSVDAAPCLTVRLPGKPGHGKESEGNVLEAAESLPRSARPNSWPNRNRMNQAKRTVARAKSEFIRMPAYPFTARHLFGALRQTLAGERQIPMTTKRIAQLLGRSASTTHFWFEVYSHPQVLSFMALLERLSPAQRQAFVQSHCRLLPTLDHPLIGQSGAISCQRLLQKNNGLTFISGASDSTTFILTAIGHTAMRFGRAPHNVVGIDLHRPNAFVPIETVHYIDSVQNASVVSTLANMAWVRIVTSMSPLVLLNGVWSLVPELRKDIINLSQKKHVMIADHETPAENELASAPCEVDSLTVSGSFRLGEMRIKLKRVDR